MTRSPQRSTRKRIKSRPDRWLAARDTGRIRAGRVLTAQARIASGYYERPEVQEYLLDALLAELQRH